MRDKSHKTPIGIIRDYVNQWRKRERWSRETVAQLIVDTHIKLGADVATEIYFDNHTKDIAIRQKAYADRIFRWLDDENKDNNLLCVNFLPSILNALPPDLKQHCANEFAGIFGFTVIPIHQDGAGKFDPKAHTKNLIKESSEAESAMLDVTQDQSLSALKAAHKEVSDLHAATEATKVELEARIAMAQGVVH